MKKILGATAIALVVASTGAQAAPASYVTVGTHYFVPGNIEDSGFDIAFDGGVGLAAAFGVRENNLRYEFEFAVAGADYATVNGVDISTAKLGFSYMDFAANILMDFPAVAPDLTPFAGFGGGYQFGKATIDGEEADEDTTFDPYVTAEAGLTYSLASRIGRDVAVAASYRYQLIASEGSSSTVFIGNQFLRLYTSIGF